MALVKVAVSMEQLVFEGPFGTICRCYKAAHLKGQGEGTGKVNVIAADDTVLGYIPLLENGQLTDVTFDQQTQKVFVSFNEIVRAE